MFRDYYENNLAEVNYREVSNLALFLNILKFKYLTVQYHNYYREESNLALLQRDFEPPTVDH